MSLLADFSALLAVFATAGATAAKVGTPSARAKVIVHPIIDFFITASSIAVLGSRRSRVLRLVFLPNSRAS